MDHSGGAPGGQRPPLGSPYGRAGERSASLRGRRQWQIRENAEIAAGYPLSHDTFSIFATTYTLSVTAYAVPALPKGEPRGGCAAQSRPPHAIEPGDPQRCGSAARVADSSLPAGSTRPLSHGFQPCQLSHRESQGAAAPPSLVHHTPSNRVTPSGVGLLPESQARHSQPVAPALSVTAYAVPALPMGEPRGGCAAQRIEISPQKTSRKLQTSGWCFFNRSWRLR